MIQALRWADQDMVRIRRGEFYELLLVTLLGMYFMISARHFLMFVIGLETASLPLAAMVAFDKHRYESREAAVKYILTAVFSSAIFMMGISYVYALSGSLYFSDIAIAVWSESHSALLVCALAFVIACRYRFQAFACAVPPLDCRRISGRSHSGHLISVGDLQGRRCVRFPRSAVAGVRHSISPGVGMDALCSDHSHHHCGQPVCDASEKHEAFPCFLVDIAGRIYHARHYRLQSHGTGGSDVLRAGVHLLQSRCFWCDRSYRECFGQGVDGRLQGSLPHQSASGLHNDAGHVLSGLRYLRSQASSRSSSSSPAVR